MIMYRIYNYIIIKGFMIWWQSPENLLYSLFLYSIQCCCNWNGIKSSKWHQILLYKLITLSSFFLTSEYDIYPTQFSLLSKNYPIGSFVRRRDTVFVEVVSAIERESFWGKPATHLLSHKNDTITLEEKTPVPHKQISGRYIFLIFQCHYAKIHYTLNCKTKRRTQEVEIIVFIIKILFKVLKSIFPTLIQLRNNHWIKT